MHGHGLPRHNLGFFPTPLTRLTRLSEALGGPALYIKRDDQSGLAMGGNKTRKLEYLVADALAHGCETLITGGAAQSNHCRQTAAAAAACNLSCYLVLGGEAPATPQGNLMLDMLLGAQIHWAGPRRKGEDISRIAEELRSAGRRPYTVPYGGSNAIGAAAFVDAVAEVQAQAAAMSVTFSHVVFASSSGGTHAGMMVGERLHGLGARVIGVLVDKSESSDDGLDRRILAIANELAEQCALPGRFELTDLVLDDRFCDSGYGVVGEQEREAIRLMAHYEGILVDPVYTGRALAGLIAMIKQGAFVAEDSVLFWHTGGLPALFAYAGALVAQGAQESGRAKTSR